MHNQSGFTLIEIMIVAALLAILAGVLVPTLDRAEDTVQDARRMSDLRMMRSVLESYRAVNGSYPDTSGVWQGDAANYGGFAYVPPNPYIPGLVPNFLPTLPKDPSDQFPTADGGYMYRSDGVDYKFVLNGTPESFPAHNIFFDPARPNTAWMISTQAARNW